MPGYKYFGNHNFCKPSLYENPPQMLKNFDEWRKETRDVLTLIGDEHAIYGQFLRRPRLPPYISYK